MTKMVLFGDGSVTCAQLENVALGRQDDLSCSTIRQEYAVDCGCQGCFSICPDGSPLSPDYNDTVVGVASDGTTETCGSIQATFAEGEPDQERCSTYQQIGVHACGCNGASLPEPMCTLCENDGQAPTNFLLDAGGGNLCFEFMAFLANVNDEPTCTAFQVTAGSYCGCNNAAASCRICNTDLPDPTRYVGETLVRVFRGLILTCIHCFLVM